MKIAILRESFPPARSHAKPERFASVLASAGHEVEFLSAEELADAKKFNEKSYWLIVLPYGSYFPAAARENFLSYLRAGGDFLSTGGYTFDTQVIRHEGRWLTREEALRVFPVDEVDIGSAGDSDYLIGEWHNPEPTYGAMGEESGTKRWTGKMAGVRLPVDPTKRYTLEISLQAEPWVARFARRLLINGRKMMDIPATGSQVIRLEIGPDEMQGRRDLEIVFDCELWVPSKISDSPDNRALGIGVNRVKLMPKGETIRRVDLSSLFRPINMRHGKPADFLEWEPEQIGVFDAGYRLTGGRSIVAARDQHIVPESFRIEGNIEGWAASGTTGSNWYWTTPSDRSRLIPLLEVKDGFGRFRGNGGALMINYLGPYKGSLWAYFGVETRDIFSARDGERLLLSVVDGMKRGIFLYETRTDYHCYRQGEKVELSTNMINLGKSTSTYDVRLEIVDERGEPMFSEHHRLELAPGETKSISASWQPGVFEDDFYRVRADILADGVLVDTQWTGFYVWNENVLSGGMPLSYSANYLHDAGVPRFMLGVQAFYPTKAVSPRSPLCVDRDFQEMSDMGIHIARSFTRGDMDEPSRRFTDALVMASQRHRVAFFMEGVAGLNYEPEKNVANASLIAERYRNVRGMMIDIQNEPNYHQGDDPVRDALFNEYLERLYGDNENLKAAWGDELAGEELGKVRMTWYGPDWTSIRSRDIYRFLLERGTTWLRTVTEAIKSKDPDRLVSVGYLHWWPSMMMDPAATSDPLDFINRHWYGKIDEIALFDANLAVSDRRYRGKAPSIGEFGSKTFPTFAESGHNYDTVEQQERRYLHIGHYTLALGGLFASNWHWRDPISNIFPYGIVHSDWTPKPVARAYRAMSLVFSGLRPRYVPPKAYLVLPDESRFGGGSAPIFEAMHRAANGLIDARLRFGSINEWDLGRLPADARLLFMPVPFAMSEAGYEKLRKFVQSGGVLYISGDFSYDENRRRTRTSRLEELAGVRFLRERYPNIRQNPDIIEQVAYINGPSYRGNPAVEFEPLQGTEVIALAGKRPVAVRRRFGAGTVIYSADPAEMTPGAPLASIYRLVAQSAGVRPETATPDRPLIHIFRVPHDGGEAVIIANEEGRRAVVSVEAAGQHYELVVAPWRQGMIVIRGGKLVGLEAQGEVRRDDKRLLSVDTHFFMIALDGEDLSRSLEIAAVPLHRGTVDIERTGLVAEVGEVRGGSWHKLANLPFLDGRIRVSRDIEGEMMLLVSKDRVGEARERVSALLSR